MTCYIDKSTSHIYEKMGARIEFSKNINEESNVSGGDLNSPTLLLLQSFIDNTFDYFILFVPLLLLYKVYEQYHSRIDKDIPKLLKKFLTLYTFGTTRKRSKQPNISEQPLNYQLLQNSVVDTNNNPTSSESTSGKPLEVSDASDNESTASTTSENSSSRRETFLSFIVCFLGLQISFLLWGLMQERIIKYNYHMTANGGITASREELAAISRKAQKFQNSQFLVLANRSVGLALSFCILLVCNRNRATFLTYKKLVNYRHWPPLFICSYSSLSNVLSSWFQYESLIYVTFTSQLLAKSSKSIFVMLTSKIVSNKVYKLHEYICVGIIGIGIFLFSDINKHDLNKTNQILMTTFPGFLCLFGYLVTDSFTSTWQDNLIKKHSISSISLMFITNLYSVLYTFISLVKENELGETIEFLQEHKDITRHIVLLSITSAIGQIFIFVTIQKFGALVFSLIMTTRQVLSILLSSLVFQHSMSLQSVFGVSLIFFALFAQQYMRFNAPKKGVPKRNGFIA